MGDFFAKKLRENLNLTEPPFLPQTACDLLNIEFQMADFDGALGVTIFSGEKTGIIVSSSIAEEGRVNFTAAHELGHATIPNHRNKGDFQCIDSDIGYKRGFKPEELEANQFAAEWLMPEKEFYGLVKKLEPTFENIISLTEKFKTTITATATRFVELSDENLVLVFTKENKIHRFVPSKNFSFFVNCRTPLPETKAKNVYLGKTDCREYEYSSSDEWFSGRQPRSGEVLESSLKLRDYDSMLTLLHVEA